MRGLWCGFPFVGNLLTDSGTDRLLSSSTGDHSSHCFTAKVPSVGSFLLQGEAKFLENIAQ